MLSGKEIYFVRQFMVVQCVGFIFCSEEASSE